nr:hypothetical protein [uncultured Hyphomonas sp.]
MSTPATPSKSEVVAEGMKRVCSDFHKHLSGLGFKRAGKRTWKRRIGTVVDCIHLQRHGATYGAPINYRVDIRIMLSVARDSGKKLDEDLLLSDPVRKPSGYAYHHRFNALSWSTYDRCVIELAEFADEFAEPWFASRRQQS